MSATRTAIEEISVLLVLARMQELAPGDHVERNYGDGVRKHVQNSQNCIFTRTMPVISRGLQWFLHDV